MRHKGIKQQLLGSLILVIVFLISGAVSASDQPPAGVRVIEVPDLKVGDTWVYNYKDGHSLKAVADEKGERRIIVVDSITDREIVSAVKGSEGGGEEDWWKETSDRQWNTISRRPDPDRGAHQFREFSPSTMSLIFPLWEGKKWKAKYKGKDSDLGRRL